MLSRIDLVIFGATGFAGKHAVKELCRIAKTYPGLSWGIAGRSQAKLEALLKDISKETGQDLSSVTIIVADVEDEKSLKEMCSQCKVLVNCCGPYRHYGEPVVRAAIEGKSHYVDITAEAKFMETMKLEYDTKAREAGVYVISACGFDFIPNDLGVIFLQQNFGGILNSVESYLSLSMPPELDENGLINFATWESVVYGVSHYNELPEIRKKAYPESLPMFRPNLKSRWPFHKRDGNYNMPYPSEDVSVVYRTQRHLYEMENIRPAQIKTYVQLPTFIAAIKLTFAAIVLFLMSRSSCTRKYLLKYPAFFTFGMITKSGPSEATMNGTLFSFKLYGEGWEDGTNVESERPNKKMIAKVSGVNPAYGATVVALLFSAITILKEKEKMPASRRDVTTPSPAVGIISVTAEIIPPVQSVTLVVGLLLHKGPASGGVLTTGVAFRNTSIIQHLHENNLKFEIVKNNK